MERTVQKTIAILLRRPRDDSAPRATLELPRPGETLLLRGKQHLRLHRAVGWTITAHAGVVWITQDGDPRDIVLQAGQSFAPDRDGELLLSPLGEARIRLAHACPAVKLGTAAFAPAGMAPALT